MSVRLLHIVEILFSFLYSKCYFSDKYLIVALKHHSLMLLKTNQMFIRKNYIKMLIKKN